MNAFDEKAGAAPAGAPLTPADRSTEFVAVQGGSEGTSAETLLVVAYLVMWAILLAFLLLTWRKQSRIEARLSDIDAALRRQPKS
jgi:CcmD family protein